MNKQFCALIMVIGFFTTLRGVYNFVGHPHPYPQPHTHRAAAKGVFGRNFVIVTIRICNKHIQYK